MSNMLKLDYNNMLQSYVGEHGLTQTALDDVSEMAGEASVRVQGNRGSGWLKWMELPYNQDGVVDRILELRDSLKDEIDDFIVLGIGGSALGNIALQTALRMPYWNILSRERRGGAPRLWVLDNIDPVRIRQVMRIVNWERTVVNVITKSGGTAETMGQFFILYDELIRKLGLQKARKRVIATTDAEKGSLRRMVLREGWASFVVPDGVGGRFSVLSPVGLVSAAFTGVDVRKLLVGASQMDAVCRSDDMYANPALINAAMLYLFMKAGKNIHVMMPYSDELSMLGDWYAQLWAESLGKKVDRNGNDVFFGQTPVKALGVTDQHSQVQLYTEGPFDKVFTFLTVKHPSEDIPFPNAEIAPGINADYFIGHTLGELFEAERLGTVQALSAAGRPNETITLPELSPELVGQLLFMLEMQTAYAGELLNIDTFNQPGVEAGKKRAFALLGRSGYEDIRAEIDSAPPPDEKHII